MAQATKQTKRLRLSHPSIAVVELPAERRTRAPSPSSKQRQHAGLSGAAIVLSPDTWEVLNEGLEDALSMLRADRGNIQIVDPATGALKIVVQAGFSDEFLEYFATVDNDASACGRAAQHLTQTVIPDVNADSGFAPHREIAASTKFRAVQSTPLVDMRGQLVGVLSTHYPRPYRPSDPDLQLIRRFGELIGQAVDYNLDTGEQAIAS